MRKALVYIALLGAISSGCASLPSDKDLVGRLDAVTSNQGKKEKAALIILGPEYDLFQSIVVMFVKGKPQLLWSGQWIGELLLNEGYKKEDIFVLTTDYVYEMKIATTLFPGNQNKETIFEPRNVFRLDISNYEYIIDQLRLNPPEEFFLYVCTHGSKEEGILGSKANNLLFSREHDIPRRISGGDISIERLMEDLYSIDSRRFLILESCNSGEAIDYVRYGEDLTALFSSLKDQISLKGLLGEGLLDNWRRGKDLTSRMKNLNGKNISPYPKSPQRPLFYRRVTDAQSYRGGYYHRGAR